MFEGGPKISRIAGGVPKSFHSNNAPHHSTYSIQEKRPVRESHRRGVKVLLGKAAYSFKCSHIEAASARMLM